MYIGFLGTHNLAKLGAIVDGFSGGLGIFLKTPHVSRTTQ